MREHLARCSECAAEHAGLAGLPRLLVLAAPMDDDGPLAPGAGGRGARAGRDRAASGRAVPPLGCRVPPSRARAGRGGAGRSRRGRARHRPGRRRRLPRAGLRGRAAARGRRGGQRSRAAGPAPTPASRCGCGSAASRAIPAPSTRSCATRPAGPPAPARSAWTPGPRLRRPSTPPPAAANTTQIRVVRRTAHELGRRPDRIPLNAGGTMTRTIATLAAALALALAGCGSGEESTKNAGSPGGGSSSGGGGPAAGPLGARRRLAEVRQDRPAGQGGHDHDQLRQPVGDDPARHRGRGRGVRHRHEGQDLHHRGPAGRRIRVLLPGRDTRGPGHEGHAHGRVSSRATRCVRKSKIASRSRATNSRRAISPNGPNGSA